MALLTADRIRFRQDGEGVSSSNEMKEISEEDWACGGLGRLMGVSGERSEVSI
jgi:hypothetical protein